MRTACKFAALAIAIVGIGSLRPVQAYFGAVTDNSRPISAPRADDYPPNPSTIKTPFDASPNVPPAAIPISDENFTPVSSPDAPVLPETTPSKTASPALVPEPGTIALCALGVGALLGRKRRKRESV